MLAKRLIPGSIERQMLVASSIILFVVLGIAAAGIMSVIRTKNNADAIHTHYLPLQKASTRAELLVQEAAHTTNDAILDVTRPEDYDLVRRYAGELNRKTLGFDMYVKAMAWGSESEVFKRSSGGLTFAEWQRAGLEGKLRVLLAPPRIRKLAGEADIYYAGFANNALRVINSHKQALRLELTGAEDEATAVRQDVVDYRNSAERYEQLTIAVLGEVDAEVDLFVSDLRAEIERSQATIILTMIVLFSTLAVFLLVFTTVFSRIGIITPLVKLAQAARAIGRGEFDVRVDVKTNDEFRALAGAFNKMAEDLRGATVELTTSNEQLRREITERTQAEEALQLKAQELTRSNAELEQFASVASHDLQEPVRKIQAFSELLASKSREGLDESSREYLGRINGAAMRMGSLITGLLELSRVTTQGQPSSLVDLNKVTEEVLSDLDGHIERSGCRVDIGDLPVIEADPMQMRMLMQNLIGNAVKFQKPEDPSLVTIKSRALDGASEREVDPVLRDEFCELTVQDNGIGFDEKYADRIFGIFQRLNGRTAYEGTGIGLATCRKIVERHGGRIQAKGTLGEGATFVVTLPVQQPKETQG